MIALTIGPVHTLTQNVIYAMPARQVLLFSNLALQVDNEAAFGSFASVSALTSVVSSATFVRCTGGNALVRLVA